LVWSRLKKALLSTLVQKKRVGLFFLFSFLLLLSAVYLLLTRETGHPGIAANIGHQLVTLVGYTAFWFFLSEALKNLSAGPKRAFWHVLMVGIICLAVQLLIRKIPGSFGDNGESLAPATTIKTILLVLTVSTACFVLLLRFRKLALYRRTRNSERNWYMMLISMLLTGLFVNFVMLRGGSSNQFQWLFIVAVLGLMGVVTLTLMFINSLRLSWIVRLSFWDKMKTMGVATLLLILLGYQIFSVISNDFSQIIAGVQLYNPAIVIFALLSVLYGLIYSTTALLFLLFHLPTTSDFQRRDTEMAIMSMLADMVNQVVDPHKLAETITISAVKAGSGISSWLAVTDPETGSLEPRVIAAYHVDGVTPHKNINTAAFFEEIVLTRKYILVEQAITDHRVSDQALKSRVRSLLVIPLTAHDAILGALFVAKNVTEGFEQDDIDVLTAFASQATIALENALLVEEKIQRERLSRELAIARNVQQKLLPQRLPYVKGLALTASSVSAQEVGGDYYDFVRLDDDRLVSIVADVAGKGTSAAFYMAELQGIFHSLTHLAPEPADFLSHANQALRTFLERNTFISVMYGLFNLQEEVLYLARAGHCPAIMVSRTGEGWYLRPNGIGLGMAGPTLFSTTLEVKHVRLTAGDSFVFVTDGVVESRNADGEEYGYERLLRLVRLHADKEPAELHELILDDLHLFMGSNHQYNDDLTLVILQWHGRQETPEINNTT